jgi:hypothetical protein
MQTLANLIWYVLIDEQPSAGIAHHLFDVPMVLQTIGQLHDCIS